MVLCRRNLIYIRQVQIRHLELSLGHTETFFNYGSMTMKFQILNVGDRLGRHVGGVCNLGTEKFAKKYIDLGKNTNSK